MSTLRVEAINSIIKLLNQLIEMGKNPNYICQRQSSSSSSSSSKQPTITTTTNNTTSRTTTNQAQDEQVIP